MSDDNDRTAGTPEGAGPAATPGPSGPAATGDASSGAGDDTGRAVGATGGPGGSSFDRVNEDPPTWPGWSGHVGHPGGPGSEGGPGDPSSGGPGDEGTRASAPQGGYGPYGPQGGYGPYGYGPPGGYGGYGYGGWGPGWPPPPAGGWGAGGGPGGRPTGRKPRRHLVFGAAALLTVVAVLLGVGIGYTVWSTGTTSTSSSRLSPTNPFGFGTRGRTAGTGGGSSRSSSAAGSPSDISSIAAKVDPALVDINTVLGYQNGQAAGTGMVLTASGEVLTNNHVIEGATKISATDIGNGKTYPAIVVGYDRARDVAVIQLQGASGLQTVSTDTSTVSVGQAVVGIGNAGGLGGKPATAGGSVVALNQAITASDQADSTTEHLTGLIETNAHIEAGDSGGPLVNVSGKVIGMDTAASAAQGFTFRGGTGNGYAIPIGDALSTAKQVEAGNGSPTVHIGKTAFLGVGVESVGQASRGGTGFLRPGAGGLPFTRTPTATTGTGPATSGAAVVRVVQGSPAMKAGITSGDVITGLGGRTVTSPNSLSDDLIPYHPGDKVAVQWTSSSGQHQTATVQLATGPAA